MSEDVSFFCLGWVCLLLFGYWMLWVGLAMTFPLFPGFLRVWGDLGCEIPLSRPQNKKRGNLFAD